MRRAFQIAGWALLLVAPNALRAEIIDRIAVIVGNRIVKDSDIEREIRVVSFLNQAQPDFSLAERKKAASRLIDQALIREEIQTSGGMVAPMADGERLFEQIQKQRYPQPAAFRQALGRYGITEQQLKDALLWQLTVLRFIDQRFQSAATVPDSEVQDYYQQHHSELEKEHPQARNLADLQSSIVSEISEERTNEQFESWLDQTRKDARIEYKEGELR